VGDDDAVHNLQRVQLLKTGGVGAGGGHTQVAVALQVGLLIYSDSEVPSDAVVGAKVRPVTARELAAASP
jgi:hypothetical protein